MSVCEKGKAQDLADEEFSKRYAEELEIADKVSGKKSFGVAAKSVEPFQSPMLHPYRGPFYGTGHKIEGRPDTQCYRDLHGSFVFCDPFFLFGAAHPHKQDIRSAGSKFIQNVPALLGIVFKAEAW